MAKATNSTASYNPKEAYDQACQELLDAIESEEIIDALARGMYVKNRKTEPPQSAIPTVDDIVAFLKDLNPMFKGVIPTRDDIVAFLKAPNHTLIEWREKEGFTYDDLATDPIMMYSVVSFFPVDAKDFARLTTALHGQWRTNNDTKHPLSGVVKAWQNRPPKPEQASVATANNMTRIGYTNTHFLINRWQDLGVDVIEVDGMPIGKITNMPDGKQPRIYAPTQASIEELTMPFPKKYNAMQHPIMLGYERLNTIRPESIRANRHTAKLLYMALATNSDIEVTLDEGAGLLVGGKDGKRMHGKIVKSDRENFRNAFWTLDGLRTFWDRSGKIEQFKMIRTDQSMNGYIFGPSTLMRQLQGYYTLSASFGPLSVHRKGELWLVLTACEYHLARGAFNPHAGIPKALKPIRDGGPGPWQEMPWREFMNLHGDYWNKNDRRAKNNAKRRYQIIRQKLKTKYYTRGKNENLPAEADDTVEFREFHGGMEFRATAQYIEAYNIAQQGNFVTERFTDYFGV